MQLLLLLVVGPCLAAAAAGSQQQTSTTAAAAAATAMPPAPLAAQPAGSTRQQQQYTEPTTIPPPPAPTPAPPAPQKVAEVLLGLYQSYAGPMIKAAQHLFSFGLKQPEWSAVQLPQCQQTNVLLNAGHFPAAVWPTLTAEQQTLHPINLVMMQLAYMAYRPVGDVTSCLAGMGADLSTLHNFTLPIMDFNTQKTAYVFRAGKERVFVLFRGSSETDIAINIACRQEEPAHEVFGVSGGPQIKVHRGYWKAWQTLEPGVVGAVQLLLKEVRTSQQTTGQVQVVEWEGGRRRYSMLLKYA